MKRFVLILALFFVSTTMAQLPMPPEQVHEIIIHNRILTRVNGRTISVLDVVKNMDVYLNRHYPQYLNSQTARFQFYTTQWRSTLQQMIDTELMVADAESKSITVTEGEVRKEFQSRFGPNVMATLDLLNLSPEEAKRLIHQEMVVQRIQGLRIMAKVLQKVSSQSIKEGYQNFLKENPPTNLWVYQFVTLKASDEASLSQLAQQFKAESQNDLKTAAENFKERLPPDATLSLSKEFTTEDKALSKAHKEVLQALKPGIWSEPIRSGEDTLRIFCLKSHTEEKPPSFATVASNLRNHMLNQTADTEMQVYRKRLYKRFNFDENTLDIPAHFEPFSAR
jgi:hypothetical protein